MPIPRVVAGAVAGGVAWWGRLPGTPRPARARLPQPSGGQPRQALDALLAPIALYPDQLLGADADVRHRPGEDAPTRRLPEEQRRR